MTETFATSHSFSIPGAAIVRRSRRAPSKLALAVLILFAVACERDVSSLPFTFSCGALLAAITLALSGRPRFSIFVAGSLLAMSGAASLAKYRFLAVNAHVFDLSFYLSKPDTLEFLVDQFGASIFGAGAALAAFAAIAAWMHGREARIPRLGLRALAAAAIVAAIMPYTLPSESGELAYHIRKNHFVSSFFVSLTDLARLAQPDPLAERLAGGPSGPAFAAAKACPASIKSPDIFLVLSESGVVPSRVPGWKFNPDVLEDFKSYDGQIHAARVETHGGGTWITHTSVMSGVSMADFGWIRPYVTMLLKGRLRHGLAWSLADCGYRTAVISPQTFAFVNEGPLLKSLGIQDYLDMKAINAPSKHEADSFYYARALDYYRGSLKDDGRPLFVFIETMTAHSPYFDRFEPARMAKGEPFGNDPETDEYLRRETFAQEDYRAFIAAIDAARGARPALVAEFGDHHPAITQKPFEAAGESMTNFASPLFETFYAVTPMGFAPPVALPKVDVLDVAYLGAVLMETAGLPLDPAFTAQRALLDHCAGAFHTCADRPAVDAYLKRMVASGMIAGPEAGERLPAAYGGDRH